METMTNTKGTQALQLSDDDFTTENPVTHENVSTINTHSYSTPWIFLIVLLPMLIIFALYWILKCNVYCISGRIWWWLQIVKLQLKHAIDLHRFICSLTLTRCDTVEWITMHL